MPEINETTVPDEQNVPREPNTDSNKPSSRRRGKKKFVIGAFLVLFIIAGGIGVGVAKNKADKFRDHGPFGFIMDKVVKDLDLNDQQKKEVEKIRDEVKAKMEDKRNNRNDHMSQFEQMFRSDTFDKQKAIELARQRDAHREEMRNFFIDETAKFHAILTPDQRNKAADKMKEFREKKGEHFKDGHRGRDKE
jgi:periplasmic protein CpxP/Spy